MHDLHPGSCLKVPPGLVVLVNPGGDAVTIIVVGDGHSQRFVVPAGSSHQVHVSAAVLICNAGPGSVLVGVGVSDAADSGHEISELDPNVAAQFDG